MNREGTSGSKIGAMILDSSFSYLQPYFYRHPFALRCGLGIGDDDETYMKNAQARAEAIFGILFPDGPDAVFAVYEKMAEFYPKSEPFFLPYDTEEMKRRLDRTDG